MATHEAPATRAVSLHDVPASALRALLQAERRQWRGRLRWDCSEAVELTSQALDHGLMSGAAIVEGSRYRAYLGAQPSRTVARLCGAHVPADLVPAAARALVAATLRTLPAQVRVEGQVAAFEAQDVLDDAFRGEGLAVEGRTYMERALPFPEPVARRGLEQLRPEHVAACARVLVEAHRSGIEARINAAFRGLRSAHEYLSDLIASQGCGVPRPEACVVALRHGSVVGFCLGTTIADGVGHVPQIAVEPAAQEDGVGKALLATTLAALARGGCAHATLSVSVANARAATWYARSGFTPVTRFGAYVREQS